MPKKESSASSGRGMDAGSKQFFHEELRKVNYVDPEQVMQGILENILEGEKYKSFTSHEEWAKFIDSLLHCTFCINKKSSNQESKLLHCNKEIEKLKAEIEF